MRKAVIYVFSGTGNTRIAAEQIAKALSGHDMTADVWEVRRPFSGAPDPNDYDMTGFGYPVHAFNTPQFFLRFVKTLPMVSGTPAFVFKTSGEPFDFNDASSRPLVRILRKKGFALMQDRHLLMPYNIVFRYEDALAKQMYLHTRDMAGVIADRAASGTPQKLRYNPLTVFLMYLFRLQWFGAWINGPMIHVRRDLCTGCGLCAKMCPARNIRMQAGYPHFFSTAPCA
jgi:flavodoxin/NAD-dependent dihydropyrimidine dehydrogenase PreA subunit